MIRLHNPEMDYIDKQARASGMAYAAVVRELIIYAREHRLTVSRGIARVSDET